MDGALDLTPRAVAALNRQHAQTEADRERVGRAYGRAEVAQANPDLVFRTRLGAPLRDTTVRSNLRRLCEASGVARIHAERNKRQPDAAAAALAPHGLRHAYASNHLNADPSSLALVSKHLGHGSVRITEDIYAHLMREGEASLAKRTAAMYGTRADKETATDAVR